MHRRGFLARLIAAPIVALVVLKAPVLDAVAAAEPEVVGVATYFQAGDVITIAGRYALNPVTRRTTGHLQRFMVTADVQAGELLPTTLVHPPIRTSGPYQNVTGDVPSDVIDGRDVSVLMWGDVVPCVVEPMSCRTESA